ncbi:capsule biosynthesis protein [Muribaculaceae bacterium Isolate-042 (Harlan)]|uniref:Capsule biosynthesis protein n=5 Tax=Muribaculum intestinale TaxID=1796646 RepID=A0A1B1SD24_9BACT|nr:capsule biosynthesis protein [Muribaculum intestinale]ROS81917.1 capsule biosynthesis protein [Muribaculaceae bacterium Isolate-042 (Harlan)]ASB39000.1 capsule biosynthesis protein [Muribaculum intestinale]MYM11852.1 capsule biosynthesis protein [Muribaculum intestinale]PWB04725.1 capsule biosynthesis protein [Muribaculum intestinale]
MTDQQVIDYIKQQTAAGKSNQQIGKELMAKGVTREQAQRIKEKFESQQNSETSPTTQSISQAKAERRHNVNNDIASESMIDIGREVDEGQDGQVSARQIYGHKVFNSRALTFEPSENIATPQNYRLGPGDEVIIDIWGTSEDHLRQTISPEGSIMISQIGPVYLNGMTINDANKHIKNAFSKKYAGMEDAETDIQVTLGQVRTIQVDILGEVATPGTFRMSPFASVFHALYRAGGINDIGSLRNIQVLRNGKKVAGVDIYEYLFDGKTNGNIRLQEGDVIIVPPYDQLVSIDGNVKRPMYYEIKPDETIKSLLEYSGGFTGDAYEGMVRLARQSGTENELYNIERGEFASYRLQDGDIITVGTILDRYANRVELKGAVYRPGMFAIGKDINTVSDLVKKADGVTDDAYTDRVLLYREGPDLELQIMALDLKDILEGRAKDVTLKRNDVLVISSIHELEERGALSIGGQVARPGSYPFAANTTLEDLIFQAGGLLEGASTARVDISRRIVDPTSTQQTQQISEIYTVSIENGLALNSGKGFKLMPYDHVEVRKSPGYNAQESVSVRGEVLFDGSYVLQKRNERLTDIIKRAGGILDEAYIKGAYLTRRLSEDELASRREVLRLAMANSGPGMGDSIALSKINVSPTYNVGINLEKAIQNPGSHYDVVLQPGDALFIPEQQSTVKIAGDVMFPNTVVYEPGKKLSYYIDQAGGYGQRARKNKAFIVYLNGTVAKAKRGTPIEPGCQIIVPSKPDTSNTDWTKILTLATSFSSVAALGATITNIFK